MLYGYDGVMSKTVAPEVDPLAEPDAPTPPGEELASDSALLVVKRGPNAGSRIALDRPSMSAGRHPGSDIFLDDITVSRLHAEFRMEDCRFRIVDTDSLNGTHVNGQPVDSIVLANGDVIQIGNFRLVFMTRPTPG